MTSSEKEDLRKRKRKKILFWSTGIIAIITIVTTIAILILNAQSGYITA